MPQPDLLTSDYSMKLTTINTKKQGPKGEIGGISVAPESRATRKSTVVNRRCHKLAPFVRLFWALISVIEMLLQMDASFVSSQSVWKWQAKRNV